MRKIRKTEKKAGWDTFQVQLLEMTDYASQNRGRLLLHDRDYHGQYRSRIIEPVLAMRTPEEYRELQEIIKDVLTVESAYHPQIKSSADLENLLRDTAERIAVFDRDAGEQIVRSAARVQEGLDPDVVELLMKATSAVAAHHVSEYPLMYIGSEYALQFYHEAGPFLQKLKQEAPKINEFIAAQLVPLALGLEYSTLDLLKMLPEKAAVMKERSLEDLFVESLQVQINDAEPTNFQFSNFTAMVDAFDCLEYLADKGCVKEAHELAKKVDYQADVVYASFVRELSKTHAELETSGLSKHFPLVMASLDYLVENSPKKTPIRPYQRLYGYLDRIGRELRSAGEADACEFTLAEARKQANYNTAIQLHLGDDQAGIRRYNQIQDIKQAEKWREFYGKLDYSPKWASVSQHDLTIVLDTYSRTIEAKLVEKFTKGVHLKAPGQKALSEKSYEQLEEECSQLKQSFYSGLSEALETDEVYLWALEFRIKHTDERPGIDPKKVLS